MSAIRWTSWLALLVGPAVLVAGCAEPIPVAHDVIGEKFYTRCNLQPDEEKLYSSNYDPSKMGGYRPGSTAEITMFSAIRVDMKVNNIPHQMYPVDGDFNTGGIEEFVNKYFVRDPAVLGIEDPKAPPVDDEALEDGAGVAPADDAPEGDVGTGRAWDMTTFDKGIRAGVESGTASIGMTKEQVFMAIGPPAQINFGQATVTMPLETIMDANRWVYFTNSITPWWFQKVYVFDGERLTHVEQ